MEEAIVHSVYAGQGATQSSVGCTVLVCVRDKRRVRVDGDE